MCSQGRKRSLLIREVLPCGSQKTHGLLLPANLNAFSNLSTAFLYIILSLLKCTMTFYVPLTSEWEKSHFSDSHKTTRLVSGHRQICQPGKQKLFGPKKVRVLETKALDAANRPPRGRVTLAAPSPGSGLGTVPPVARSLTTAVLESGTSKGPSHFPFAWTSKKYKNSQSRERSQ